MAFTSINTGRISGNSFLARAREAFVDFLDEYSRSQSRLHEIEALQALSDEQLAARGLTRDGIFSHVFSDKFYL